MTASYSIIYQAIVKSMLNSPTADQGGYCDLFSAPELRQLASREPKLINKIAEANTAICTIDTFLSAYAKITPRQLQSLKSIMEVKSIMHAFGKKFDSRPTYQNFNEVMKSIVDEARRMDHTLPRLSCLPAEDAGAVAANLKQLKELGKTPNAELEAKGFKVGAKIQRKADVKQKDIAAPIFMIKKLNADLTTITVVEIDAEKEDKASKLADSEASKLANKNENDGTETTINRSELVTWNLVVEDRIIFYTDILNYASNMNLVKGIIEGQVKQIIMKQVSVKAEDSTLVMTNGKLNVHAKGKWDVGKLNLFPLTTQVATSVKALELPWVNIGKHEELHIYIKGSNTALKDSARPHLKNKTELVSRYWVVAAQQTPDARISNCAFVPWTATITVGKAKVELELPSIQNSVELEDEAMIIVLAPAAVKEESSAKRRKSH